MALRFYDSFDHYTGSDLPQKWSNNNSFTISANGRNGTSALDTNGSTLRTVQKIIDSQATWIIGFAIKFQTLRSSPYEIVQIIDNATVQVVLSVGNGQKLHVYRGVSNGGTLLGSGTTVLTTGVFYYIELKVTINDTTGVAVVKINGVTDINLSSQDTKASSNATADTIQFGGDSFGALSVNNYIDDVYMCDGSGSSPTNDFLGDCRAEALFPNGNGNSSQWVGSDGNSTDNYLLVDETTPNSDTDYVESSTVGDKDTYAYGNLSSTSGTVYAVQPLLWAKKTDAGTRSVVSVARLSGTEVDSAAETLSTNYTYLRDIRETKPGGGSWSISDVNSAEFGVKVNA